MTDVRVLMPCFNDDPAHIGEAIASLDAQEGVSWELVIVDDGSSHQATLSYLESLSGRDDVTIIYQENAGPSAARNSAAQGAHTTYLLSLDSDDRISPNFLSTTKAVLEANEDVAAVYGTTQKFGAASETVTGDEFSWEKELVVNVIPVTALVRRQEFEDVGGFDTDMRDGLEDHEFFLRLLSSMHKVAQKVPAATLFYRIREGSRNASAHDDLATMYRARGQLMARHAGLYREHPELIFASELRFREECLRWRARYGRVEKAISMTPARKALPHIG